jgi:hypothetical protein
MKTTLSKVVNAIEPLNAIIDMDLPARTAFKVMTLADELDEHVQRYNKLRTELFQKYGDAVLDEEGNDTGQIQIAAENNEAFAREHQDLLSEEIELHPVRITLADLEQVNIKPRDLMRLRPFITEE